MKFDGFMRVYLEGQDEAPDEDDVATLPAMTEGEILKLLKPLEAKADGKPANGSKAVSEEAAKATADAAKRASARAAFHPATAAL